MTTDTGTKPAKRSPEQVEKFLQEAHRRFKVEAEASRSIREAALEDLRFRIGKQWDEALADYRTQEEMPILVINQFPKFLKQVVNEVRQNKTEVLISPVSSGADEKTAEVLEGIIRHVQYESDADIAYETAAMYAIACGFGYFRIRADYEDEQSFAQKLVIDRIPNPFLVYMGAGCQKPDYSDAKWAFIIQDIPEKEYELLYPNSELSSASDMSSVGDTSQDWISGDHIRVAEYFYLDEQDETLCLLADGSVGLLSELPKGANVIQQRPTKKCVVKWAKINATEVLEERDLPGYCIPIVPILGDEIVVDGERFLESLLRHAKDAQSYYNLQVSQQALMISNAPKAPYQITPLQEQGFEEEYKTANHGNKVVLHYNPDPNAPGPPQRQAYEPAIQAISIAIQQARGDLQDTAAIYNSALGQAGPEVSGSAINARNAESDTANFHFIDNVTRALKHAGRIYLSYIQEIYDTPRVLSILGIDQQPKAVQINQPFQDEQGITRIIKLDQGKYNVIASSGPGYETKRKESAQNMMMLVQAYPALMQIAGDLIVRNMDWAGADALADRLAKALPPNLQEQAPQPIPPEAQAQIAQLTKALNEAQNYVATDQAKQQANIQIANLNAQKELKLKAMDIESRITIAQITAKSGAADAQAQREYDLLDTIAGFQQQSVDNAHEAGMAAMQHAHGQIAANNAADRQAAQQQSQPGGVSEQQTSNAGMGS